MATFGIPSTYLRLAQVVAADTTVEVSLTCVTCVSLRYARPRITQWKTAACLVYVRRATIECIPRNSRVSILVMTFESGYQESRRTLESAGVNLAMCEGGGGDISKISSVQTELGLLETDGNGGRLS